MTIGRFQSVRMANANIITITTITARTLNHTIARRINRRSARRGKINALMHTVITQHRVVAHTIARRNARTINRCFHQRVFQIHTIFTEILGVAVFFLKPVNRNSCSAHLQTRKQNISVTRKVTIFGFVRFI